MTPESNLIFNYDARPFHCRRSHKEMPSTDHVPKISLTRIPTSSKNAPKVFRILFYKNHIVILTLTHNEKGHPLHSSSNLNSPGIMHPPPSSTTKERGWLLPTSSPTTPLRPRNLSALINRPLSRNQPDQTDATPTKAKKPCQVQTHFSNSKRCLFSSNPPPKIQFVLPGG